MASRKELLKSNLDELNKKIGLELSIYFEEGGRNFIILDFKKNVLMIEDIYKYDYTLEGQLDFINDIGNKALKFFMEADEMYYERIPFCGSEFCDEEEYCIEFIKGGNFDNFIYPVYSIEVDKNKLNDKILKEISNKLDWYIRAGYDGSSIVLDFGIDMVILDIKYKDNNKEGLLFYYSFFNEYDLNNAIKTIKELVK